MLEPSKEDQQRSIAIRCASKKGEYVSDKDHLWNSIIYGMFPEWYRATEDIIFQLTKPFGAK